MKKILVILIALQMLFSLAAEETANVRDLKFAIAKERLKVIKEDGDAANLHARILREYKKLDDLLKEHPKIKNSKLNDKALTALKLKLLQEDEDLNELRLNVIKLHRSLESILRKAPKLKKMYEELDSLASK